MGFAGSERGVSTIVGAVMLFGILFMSLVSYQVVVVPDHNSQVEFEHYQEAAGAFAEIETAFTNAVADGSSRQATLPLGTAYPSRWVALNPPPASGVVESTVDGNISFEGTSTSVQDVCGLDPTASHTFEYEPSYNELDGTARFVFENGLRYRVFADGTVLYDKERPVVDGTTIDLRPLVDEPSTTGVGSETVTFEGGTTGGTTLQAADTDATVTVSFPSRLPVEEWTDVLAENDNVVDVSSPEEGIVSVELDGDEDYELRCTPVGIDASPDYDPTVFPDDDADGDGDGDVDDINPGNDLDGDLKLEWAEEGSGGDTHVAHLQFNNTDTETRTITHIRIPFYYADSQDRPTHVEEFGQSTTFDGADRLTIGDPFAGLDEPATFDAGAQTTITIEFHGGNIHTGGDFFILSVEFDDGGGATYFVAPE